MATFRTRKKRDGSTVVNVQVRMQGFPTRTASFPTQRLAERWATKTEGSMIEGRHFNNVEARRRTVADAINKYLVEEVPKKKNGGLHRATLPWWKKRLGHLKLFAVTPDLLVECRAELAVGKFKRANPDSKRTSLKKHEVPREFQRTGSTVNRYLSTLSHVFTVARKEWRWVATNPVSDVSKLREGKPRDKVLSDDERKRLLQQISSNSTLHAFVVTSLSVAARAGELMNLTWADVDLKEGQLTFRDTKNGFTRTAWLSGESKRLFHQLAEAEHEATDQVFKNESGRGTYQYSKLFKAAAAAADVKGLVFHSIRHSAATYLARQGATEQQLKAIGGWRSNVVSRYVHLASADTKTVVVEMNKKLIGQ